MQTNEAIKLWKELGVGSLVLNFTAGGDSMGDMEWELRDSEDKSMEDNSELIDYFDRAVFDNVEFYEVSDGQYMGESGIVTITLEEDEEDEDGGVFLYDKEAQSEYEETFGGTMEVELSEAELTLLNEKIDNINGSEWDGENINYKDDCVITEEEETILKDLITRIREKACLFDIEDCKGEEVGDERNFDTGDNGEGCNIEEGVLQVYVSSRYFFTEDSDY
jgi:hypothetical protein